MALQWFEQGFSTFLFVLSTVLLNAFSAAELGDICRQAVFVEVSKGAPLTENIISSHHVQSCIECGMQCLQKKTCVYFSHLSNTSNVKINCIVSKQTGDLEATNQYRNDIWTTYQARDVESELCLTKKPCENGGQCIANSCETEGYSCKCDKRHYGKHCENRSNYDLSFRSQHPVQSYVQMDAINTDLHQLTFSVWFKINTGLQYYHLLSYIENGVTGYIDLYFRTKNEYSKPVCKFEGAIAKEKIGASITPVNDGFWHHFGFTWSNAGEWNVLIDGTLRVLKNDFKNLGIIPSGGTLVIGQNLSTTGVQTGRGFIGEISRLNLWDRALSGGEIEAMAKSPGNERGNIVMWFEIVDYVVGDVVEIIPSRAHNTDQGLDIKLTFQSLPTGKGYVLSPGPKDPFDQISVCLWIRTSSKSIFISYNTEREVGHTFAFGVDSNNTMFAYINGSLIHSTSPTAHITNNEWHFLCLTWNGQSGTISFFYEGWAQGNPVTKDTSKTVLPANGNFSVGATKDTNNLYMPLDGFVGKMSHLNAWSAVLPSGGIAAMSSGGVNINGDFLSWRDVPKSIVGNIIVRNKTPIHYPGYGLLAKRSKWCNDYVTSSCGTLYARFGENKHGSGMAWRCYCGAALVTSKYAYIMSKKSDKYYERHADLIAIVN